VCVALAVLPKDHTAIDPTECVVLDRVVRSVTMVAEARLVWHDTKVNTARVRLRASMTRDVDDTSLLWDVAVLRCVPESYASAAREAADTVAVGHEQVGWWEPELGESGQAQACVNFTCSVNSEPTNSVRPKPQNPIPCVSSSCVDNPRQSSS
jgi:hypothetical protein